MSDNYSDQKCKEDAMGALIPEGKNTDLKKVEKNIQDRFCLGGEDK